MQQSRTAGLSVFLQNLQKKFATLFSTTFSQPNYTAASIDTPTTSVKRGNRKFFNGKRPFIALAVVLALIVLGSLMLRGGQKGSAASSVLPSTDSKVDVKPAEKSQTVNRMFEFPLRDEKNKEVSKLKYQIETVEVRDEIIVQGKKAMSVKGRTFLVVNIKITNDFNQAVTINSRDYVRLLIAGSNEKLAPDIHNDPVEVQAISTKPTRIAFPIDEELKQMSLQIGEINGDKQTIQLNLK
jgi:hypothetical protein